MGSWFTKTHGSLNVKECESCLSCGLKRLRDLVLVTEDEKGQRLGDSGDEEDQEERSGGLEEIPHQSGGLVKKMRKKLKLLFLSDIAADKV